MYNIFGDFMKRQANILEYVEKYKYKYGISYAKEGSNLVKRLYFVIKILLICLCIWIPIFDASLLFNAQGKDFAFSAINSNMYRVEFYTLMGCFVLLVAILILAKKSKYFLSAALLILPVAISCFKTCTQVGLGYKTSFYYGAVPAYAAILLIAVIMFILIRAEIKTKRIYDMLVEGLYKQYGTENGEKLNEDEWQEFLKKYNPKTVNTKEDKE